MTESQRSILRHLALGATTVGLLVIGVGGWAATTELAGAVVAPGTLVVESNVKKVQHPAGGVVGEIHVAEGDRVEAGDVLVRLDAVQARGALAILSKNLDELAARQARLVAERDGVAAPEFPAELLARSDDPAVERLLTGERRLFELRRTAREGQKAQLGERVVQLRQEIEGLSGQLAAKARESRLIGQELDSIRGLWQRNLVPLDRLTALERNAARLEGESGALLASRAQAQGRITETELQIIQIDQDLRSEVARELAGIRQQTSELTERRIAAEDLLRRIDIRAPQAGYVHELAVHTVGGVIAPGEPIMLIVPAADLLAVDVRISPRDVDQIRPGQPAGLRFAAFSHATTPEIFGEVARVSPDIVQDPRTGETYYAVRIRVPEPERARLGAVKLVPGMPVEAFLKTEPRTVASYFVKPLRDQLAKAFRD